MCDVVKTFASETSLRRAASPSGARTALSACSRESFLGADKAVRAPIFWAAAILLSLLFGFSGHLRADDAEAAGTFLLIVGAPGQEQYETPFHDAAVLWEQWATNGHFKIIPVGLTAQSSGTDHDRVQSALAAESPTGDSPLWIVLVGHGTFDGKQAKFNLRGPDVSADELAGWLKPFTRPVAVINTASASAPFINKLSAPGRIIVTATKSGYEANATVFGGFLAKALGNPNADLDNDGQTSLLEGFLTASQQVAEFYKSEKRLATEHALIDDNGDGLGTTATAFRGTRLAKKPESDAGPDGVRAHQLHLLPSDEERKLSPEFRRRRNELEVELGTLREQKRNFPEEEYYARLEALLLKIARLYEGQ